MRVFVLIFNAGTNNEGIHSIRVGDRNTIMMFESEDDATRFALMLEAQDFPTPTVEGVDDQDIIDFCKSAGFGWELVPENSNTVVTPPELNVDETDWKPDANPQNTDDFPSSESEPPQISDPEIDSFRRRLEGLL
jgi:hypothetical protein